MFGLGPTELIVILVLALLVLGPARIPTVATQLGKAIRGFRKASQDLRDHLDDGSVIGSSLTDLQSALRGDPGLLEPSTPAKTEKPRLALPPDTVASDAVSPAGQQPLPSSPTHVVS